MIDYSKPTPPIPELAVQVASRVQAVFDGSEFDEYRVAAEPINQLTVNEYWPGQGIASHIGKSSQHTVPLLNISLLISDTETCFGSALFVVNLAGGIVMTLSRRSA